MQTVTQHPHTPGPLIAHKQPMDCRMGDGLDYSIQSATGVVALIALDQGNFTDIKVWAASPDLLAAAEELLECGVLNPTGWQRVTDAVDALKAAVAKARI